MLQIKDQKNLVKPQDRTYEVNPFDIQRIASVDASKIFEINFDPVNKLIFLEFTMEEETLLLTLSAKQAVDVGRWLMEAGHVVNFITSTGIQFEDAEVEEEDVNSDSE